MNYFDRLRWFRELCDDAAASVEAVANAFRTSIEEMGFIYFACCSHVNPLNPPSHAVMLYNYPPVWVQDFADEKLHRYDPVLKRAEKCVVPFRWDDAFAAHPPDERQKTVLAEAATHGLVHGYTIPIEASLTAGSLRASCSVVPDSGPIGWRSYLAVRTMAQYLYGFASRARTLRNMGGSVTSNELSARERDCVILMALGKTDWEIARMLSLSAHTVHSYVERIKRRFGVRTRIQAVIAALEHGQISFGDLARR